MRGALPPPIETIGSYFGGVPNGLPMPHLPPFAGHHLLDMATFAQASAIR